MKLINLKKRQKKRRLWALFAIALLIVVLLLSGCGTGRSSVAPDVKGYTKAQQNKAADEILGGKCPMLNEFMVDYGVMRDQSRVLKK